MPIVDHDRLLKLAGLSDRARISTLRKTLQKAGIPYMEINGRLFTTEEAIDAKLLGSSDNGKKTKPNWDALNG